ncbi:uncharacterized protein LOC134686790 [Mytilus trossulus]|uniref:uncharacterized protein LOC134686790 n=1 Tax=Mytilus trossulus TaxID=6551 RepID=UPI0030060704
MASNWRLCGFCDSLQITKSSVVWCFECDEGLCEDCREHHFILNGTNHETVSIDKNKKLPTEVLQIVQVCKLHNEKYEFFCRKHDSPCCKKCVKSHNDCTGLTDINEIIKNVKTSNAIYEIERNLLEVIENIKRLSTNRKENLKSLENKKKEIKAEIKQTRTKVNDHLDKLQDDLMKELITVEQKESFKIQKLLTTLKKKEKEITEVQENITSIKQHASELQTFLTMKDIEKDIAVEERYLQSLSTSDTMNQVNISCQIDKSLQQITASVQKFGEINFCFDLCDFSIQTKKERQAQIVVEPRYFDSVTLTLQKRINTKLSGVHGVSLLPDGRMVFSCYDQHKIRAFKSDGSQDFERNKIGLTFDVVFIGDDSIAVTSAKSDKINIIDSKEHKLKKSLEVKSYNGGAVYQDGHLIYCARKKGLQMISLSDESITNVIKNKLPTWAYVTTFDDKLFYTNCENESVTCCDYHGNILWTFCDTNVLEFPLGISADNNGNVFVVGYLTHNVVVISADGRRYRQLLSRKEGLNRPTVLHYNQSTNQLLVANRANDAFLYEVND